MPIRNIFLLLLIPTLLFAFSGKGSGTEADPYQIIVVTQLQEMNGDLSAHYRLMNDIDATVTSEWYNSAGFDPIGDRTTAFTGSLNGGGHVIFNLTINRALENQVGLIGYGDSIQIDSLGVEGTIVGQDYVGGIVGEINTNSKVSNSYSNVQVLGSSRIGGIAGSLYDSDSVENCYAAGSVSSSGANSGGLIGIISVGVVKNSYSSSTLGGGGTNRNGLIGSPNIVVPLNCFYDSDIAGPTNGSDAAYAKTTAEMQETTTFTSAGWIVSTTADSWYQLSDAYPNLGWEKLPINGDGSKDSPYEITTLSELQLMKYDREGHYRLMNNINASETKGWNTGDHDYNGGTPDEFMGFNPIGDITNTFTGSFNGGGYVIDSLFINQFGVDSSYVGLFGYIEGAAIDSVTLTNMNITGYKYAGGVVGYASDTSTVKNSSASGTLSGYRYVGGVLGYANGASYMKSLRSTADVYGVENYIGGTVGYLSSDNRLDNSSASGTVTGEDYIGGLLGYNSSRCTVSVCTSSATVTGNDDYIGNLIGYMSSGLVINSISTGFVSGDDRVGGIVGRASSATIENCWSSAEVRANIDAAGIVGENSISTIKACYSSATIYGDSLCAGGIVGENTGQIYNSYFDGNVIGTNKVGGLVGRNSGADAIVMNSFSVGAVTGADTVGGAVGQNTNNGVVNGCFWNSETSGIVAGDGGTAKTTAELQTVSTYDRWLKSTWSVTAGAYPILYWQDGATIDTSKGAGTEANPYLISTITDLQNVIFDLDAHYRVGNDIDATETQNWNGGAGFIPIGTTHIPFSGSLEGGGFTIANMTIIKPSADAALFLSIKGGTVDSLNFLDFTIEGQNAAALAVTANTALISNCSVVSTDTLKCNSYSGGLLGSAFASEILKCYSDLDILSDSRFVGGLIGSIGYETSVVQCHSKGTITADAIGTFAGDYCGGLVGQMNGSNMLISQCYSTVDINGGNDAQQTGGLIGLMDGGVLENSYASGDVHSGDGDIIGGLVGMYEAGTIDACYSIGSVSGGTNIGGLIGDNLVGPVSVNSYWDTLTSGVAISDGGFAKSTAELKDNSTYVGWNFETIWYQNSNDYPKLRVGTDSALFVGDGTEGNPYQITTVEQLQLMKHDLDAHYCLMNNIDASATATWNSGEGFEPIGGDGASFTGTLQGCGYIVSGLTINRSADTYVGLFGKMEGATVDSLGLNAVVISGDNHIGAIVGLNGEGSVISSSFAQGTVSAKTYSGGLVGGNYNAKIRNSWSSVAITGDMVIGGISGYCSGDSSLVENCYATGALTGSDYVGGITPQLMAPSEVINCFWDTTVTTVDSSQGGLGISTADMQDSSHFTNWSFPDIWCMDNGTEYPMLRWTTAELSYTSGVNGSLTGDSIQYVFIGDSSTTITAVPDNNYHVDSWSDGSSDESFKIAAVSGDTTVAVSFAQNYANGDGSLANPYQITTVEQLQWMKYDLDAHYRIMNNIDARDTKNWNSSEGFEPVGTVSEKFTGSLQGGGFSIDSLYIERQYNYVGLIGYASDSAVIDSVHLTDVFVESGSEDIAGLVGLGDSVFISNCSVTGTIYGAYYVGALIGELKKGELTSCWADATVEVNEDYAGVLAGYIDTASTISQSYTKGTVKGYTSIGGLVGYSEGRIEYSSSESVITGDNEIGGLIGTNKGKVYRSYATGSVTGTGKHGGGLIGLSRDSIVESYATGNITMLDRSGGLVGESYGKVLNSYATGSVDSKTYGGGLVGFNSDTITNCYSVGVVTDYGTDNGSGGLVGLYAPRCVAINSYVDTVAAKIIYTDQGIATDTSVLYQSDSLTDWDFASVWCMDNGTEYPLLRWTAVEVKYEVDGFGSIMGDGLQYVFLGESTDNVSANPNFHNEFVEWSDGTTATTRNDIVTGDTLFTARFALTLYKIDYEAEIHGSIAGTASQQHPYDTLSDSVTAVANEGYHFTQWNDGLLTVTRADTVRKDTSLSAQFAIDTVSLIYTAATGGTISGTATQKVTYGSNGTEVTAVPYNGYTFSMWSDGVETANRTDLSVKANINVEAKFDLIGSTAKDDTLYFTEDVDSTVVTKVLILNDSLGIGTDHSVSEIITVSAPAVKSVNLLNDSLYFTLTANASGDNSFKVVVKNSAGVADTANLIVKVAAVNDAPTLTTAKAQTTVEDTSLEVTIVMTDASDMEDILKDGNIVLGAGTNYTVSGQTITPAANFNGELTVPVSVTDGKLSSAIVNMTVTVTPVNDAPVLTTASAQTTAEEAPLTIALTMTNASDVDNVLAETGIILGAGDNYTVVGQTITPAVNFNGDLTVPVTVTDGALNSATVNMTVTVGGVNDAPVLTAATTQTTSEDTPLTLTIAMTDAVDPDGTVPTLIVGVGANYTVSGTIITPTANFNGVLTVPVAVTDGALNSATVNMTVTVTSVNDAPVLTVVSAQTVAEETPLTVTLAMTDASDVDNVLAETGITLGAGENYTAVGQTITPAVNFTGTLSVPVTVTDGALNSATVNMTITVGGVNDAPILTAATAQTTAEDMPLALTLTMTNAVDPDGDVLTLIVGAGANYTVSGTTITPAANFNGTLTVPVTVTDGALNSATVNMTVTVTPVNDAPVLTATTAQVTKQETPVTVTLAMTDACDVDNTLSDASVIVGAGENYVVEGTTVNPVVGFIGTLTVPVAVTDGALNSATVNMIITVEPTIAIKEIHEDAKGVGNFAVAPNMITNESEAHFIIGEKLSGKGRIFVVDHLGDIIDEQDVSVTDGGYFYWDLRNRNGVTVGSGMYLVILELNEKIYKRKIAIKK